MFVEDTPDSQQVAGSGQFDDALVLPRLYPHHSLISLQRYYHSPCQDQPEQDSSSSSQGYSPGVQSSSWFTSSIEVGELHEVRLYDLFSWPVLTLLPCSKGVWCIIPSRWFWICMSCTPLLDIHYIFRQMAQENRWVEAGNALNGLANYCLESGFDCDGIDLSFLNSNNKFLWSELREITVRYW